MMRIGASREVIKKSKNSSSVPHFSEKSKKLKEKILLLRIFVYTLYSVLLYLFLLLMIERITMSRRRFIEIIGRKPYTTFGELRVALVEQKYGMNLATLYRTIESFEAAGLVHQVEIDGERAVFPCQCPEAEKEKGIILNICNHCHSITDTHFPLETGVVRSQTIQYTEYCGNCSSRS